MIFTNLSTAMKVIPYIEIDINTKGRQLGTPQTTLSDTERVPALVSSPPSLLQSSI